MARDGSQFLNAHVFPGGQIDKDDNDNVRRAALRELYEEASLHLQPSKTPPQIIPQAVHFDTSQIPYSQFLKDSKASSAEANLIPYSRWITPKMLPKRFDTTFFLALSAPSEKPVDGKVDGREIKSLAWVSPSEALSLFSEGKITLFPPQWYIDVSFSCNIHRYILFDLEKSSPTFSALIKLYQNLPATLRPMAPQALNSSRKGFTMVLYGDEEYKPEESELKPRIGGRHRLTIVSESGRPRKITLERNIDTKFRL
jgi:8-oxo-dGTP pyrophosphatase MutT (NUDIX family)